MSSSNKRSSSNTEESPVSSKKRKTHHDVKFQSMLERLVEYKETHGDCLVPYRWGPDPQLGKWVNSQRLLHDQEKLSRHRIQQLDKIGFVWRVKQRLMWDEMFDRLVEFKNKTGHCLVPQRYKEDPQLGRWVDTQRENKDRRLTEEHKKRLDSIGFVWSALKESWDEMYSRLVEYKRVHGDCQVTQRYTADPKLGKWVKNQRLRRDCLSDDRVRRLEQIGFVWCVQKKQERDSWDQMYKTLQKYKQTHGNCLVPAGYPQDPKLADWVQTHRRNKTSLTAHQVKRLDSLGFEWTLPEKDMSELLWVAMYNRLVAYKEQHGTCQVLSCHDGSLALWVQRQRAAKMFGGISKEQESKLDAIGFPWQGGQDYLWTRMQEQRRQDLGHRGSSLPRFHRPPSSPSPWMSGWESSPSPMRRPTDLGLLSARAMDMTSRPPLTSTMAAASMNPLLSRTTLESRPFPPRASAPQDLSAMYAASLLEKQHRGGPLTSYSTAAYSDELRRKAQELAALRSQATLLNKPLLSSTSASLSQELRIQQLLNSGRGGLDPNSMGPFSGPR